MKIERVTKFGENILHYIDSVYSDIVHYIRCQFLWIYAGFTAWLIFYPYVYKQ